MTKQYAAEEALAMNWINTSPFLLIKFGKRWRWNGQKRCCKKPSGFAHDQSFSMNADTDGLGGIQQLAGDATLLYYTMDEEKKAAMRFKEKRQPNFDQFPKFLNEW